MKRHTYILGLTYFGNHDSCAVLFRDGKIVAAAEEERFSRIKFDRSFPTESIKWCLKKENISIKDVSYAGFFWQPWIGIGTRILYSLRGLPGSLTRGSNNVRVLFDLLRAKNVFISETGFSGKFYFLNHHITHAACCFYASPYDKAAIFSVDGTGDVETLWTGVGEGNRLTCFKTTNWPNSLGHLYATVTQYLGFKIFSDEYKVMGLAPYGKPIYIDEFRKLLKTTKDGLFKIDFSYVDYPFGKKRMYSDKWIRTFGPARGEKDEITQRHEDIAASMQLRLEEVLEHIIRNLREKTGDLPLCMAGGVALNSVAIGKLARKKIFKEMYTTPVSSDPGCALGACYYIYHNILGNTKKHSLPHAYWGSEFSEDEMLSAIKKNRLKFKKIKNPTLVAAELIAKGHVIGWYQGRSEIGQRALGDRSILADPRDPKMKDRVNALIKYREPFRPFAPAILSEHQTEYFNWGKPIPYMTEVHPVRVKKRKVIPAVTHVDGSGRLQTVLKKTNKLFWSLINEFYKITGVPVVLNTSFNVKGEPIVDSPQDAIRTYLNSGIDDLFLGKYWISKTRG